MALSEWILIGGIGLMLQLGLDKSTENQEMSKDDYKKLMNEMKNENERNRRTKVNAKRKAMPCYFEDGISVNEFTSIANRCGKKIKRIRKVDVEGPIVYCVAESQSGYSEWEFKLDFNDWGHITGTYWTQTDNDDSLIPRHFGHMMSRLILDLLYERKSEVKELSFAVDNNKELGTPMALSHVRKKGMVKKIFGNTKSLKIGHDAEYFTGEHIYPVISILKSKGFRNIKSIPVKDIDNSRNDRFCYEVEQVAISGTTYFREGDSFLEDEEIILVYHDRREIEMPFSGQWVKRKNYVDVEKQLNNLGFCSIFEEPIYDLIVGLITKEGAIQQITINGENNFSKGDIFKYDNKIIIQYHALSRSRR